MIGRHGRTAAAAAPAATAAAATEAPAVATLPGGPVPYILRHSPRARGLRVVIHPERGVIVTIPGTRDGRRHGEDHATAFLAQREAWLRRHLVRQDREAAVIADRGGASHGGRIPYLGELHSVAVVPSVSGITHSHVIHLADTRELIIHRTPRDRRTDPAIAEAWLRDRARAAIEAAIQAHADGLEVTPAAVTLRDPRTRWGSASRRGRLSFSWRLVLAPSPALETVVIHELAHLRVFGHGPRFWALVASRRPDHRTWRRWLHDHAAELHRALG